jgi:hypothetical protein
VNRIAAPFGLGDGVAEKRPTAAEKAIETPGGGRDRPSTSNASRHRRAASRSGGATSAERDGRPVYRRNGPRNAAAERDSPSRAWRSQSSLKKKRLADDRSLNGETTGTAPVAPEAPFPPTRPFSYNPRHVNCVPS